MQRILTVLPHHVRVDGSMCGMRERTYGDLIWNPLTLQANSVQVKTWFRRLRHIDMTCVQKQSRETQRSLQAKRSNEWKQGCINCTITQVTATTWGQAETRRSTTLAWQAINGVDVVTHVNLERYLNHETGRYLCTKPICGVKFGLDYMILTLESHKTVATVCVMVEAASQMPVTAVMTDGEPRNATDRR